jgi:hypothetical protein
VGRPSAGSRRRHVASAQRLSQPLHRAECVGAVVDVFVVGLEDSQPRAGDDVGGGVVPRGTGALGVVAAEEGERVKHRPPGVAAAEGHVLEEQGQEPSDRAVAGEQGGVPVAFGRLDDAGDRFERGIELWLRQLVEQEPAQVDVRLGHRLAEPHERVAQDQRGRVEVAEGPQPLPVRPPGRPSHQLADHEVERVEDVVEGGGLERRREGDEVGQPALGAHALERLGPGLGRETGECFDAPLGDAGEVEAAEAEGSHLLETVERSRHAGGRRRPRSLAEPVEAASAGAGRHNQELLERPARRRRRRRGQGRPQADGGLVVDRRDEALEHGRARQENLVLEQPCDGEVEQHARALAHGPRPCLQPLTEPALDRLVAEVPVAVRPADLRRVVPARLAVAIALEDREVGDVELTGHVVDHQPGDVGGIGQERPQEPHRAELQREPQPRPIPGAALDQGSVGVVEVEVAVELLGGRVVAETPEALPPLLGQELDRHASPPPGIQSGGKRTRR